MSLPKVTVDEKTFDKIYECFDHMEFTADDYVPSNRDLLVMMDNLPKYMPFLMWIDETGYDDEGNEKQKAMRSKIRKLIGQTVELKGA